MPFLMHCSICSTTFQVGWIHERITCGSSERNVFSGMGIPFVAGGDCDLSLSRGLDDRSRKLVKNRHKFCGRRSIDLWLHTAGICRPSYSAGRTAALRRLYRAAGNASGYFLPSLSSHRLSYVGGQQHSAASRLAAVGVQPHSGIRAYFQKVKPECGNEEVARKIQTGPDIQSVPLNPSIGYD